MNVHNGLKSDELAPINIDDYPAIKAHLNAFWGKIEKRSDKGVTPYNLRNCAYMNDFSKQKMVWKRIGSILRFCLDESGCFALDSTCIATGPYMKYLTGILNTKLGNYLFENSPKTGTGDLIVSVQAFEPVCVPMPTETSLCTIEKLVDQIISSIAANEDITVYETQLNNYVYALYCLTTEEIEFVEQAIQQPVL